MIRVQIPELSEHDIDLLTKFGVQGSRRAQQPAERVDRSGIDVHSDLIQFKHFEKALAETVQHMTKEEIERKQKQQETMLN